jgi:hypothetical protein
MARGLIRGKGFVFEPNYDLGHDLRRSGVLDHALNQLAGEIALTAKEIAVREAFDTGDYMDSIHGRLATGRTGYVVGHVQADDFKANWIEYGHRTIHGAGTGRRRIRNLTGETNFGMVKGRHVLRRAARRSGLRVRNRRRQTGG